MKNTYDARKRNLGTEPPQEGPSWKRKLIISGVVVGLLALIMTGIAIWYSMTHVTTVRASVSAEVVSLASDVDARLEELHVHTGDRVEKGQRLLRLDDSALKASLAEARATHAIKQSQLAQARAHSYMTEVEVTSEVELAKARVQMAERRVTSAQAALQMHEERMPEEVRRAQAYRDEAAARLEYLRKGARQEQIEMAKARLATARAREALREYQVEQIEKLVERNVESPLELQVMKTELLAQRNTVQEAELELQQLLAGPTTDQIEAAKQALEAREAALMLVRGKASELPVLESELAIREAELEEARAALRRAEARRRQLEVAEEQVVAAEAELEAAEAAMAEKQALLTRMTIVSPVAGTVIRTYEHVGEICRKGEPTILVADDRAGRWIEGWVREDDAALVHPGQRAEVELGVGSGDFVNAVVEEVGLTTAAIGRNGGGALGASSRADQVWVRLKPVADMRDKRPGMTARAIIRVRSSVTPPEE